MSAESVHATSVAIEGVGVLLRGASGAGKSDLAYRLIREHGALLVADDQTILIQDQSCLKASCKEGWAGQLELRGLGIVTVPHEPHVSVALVIDLVDRGEVPRLPDPSFVTLMGVEIPVLKLHAFDHSTSAKILIATEHLPRSGFPGIDGRLG
ncbi:HPr kinase/phosphatase C-terminal domain-containing protein [Parvibaculaceae bacterium PLY_AMNH_Bact1]|nr:HPr kinase/phosphatase C-terminal domain-containing protein [Parvibaculaceae bacterium PLY_AMNH_Bact1]